MKILLITFIIAIQVRCEGEVRLGKKTTRTKKKPPKEKVSTKKVNSGQCTFSQWMRNPTPSSGQNCQLMRWWVLGHAGPNSPLML